MKTALKTNSLTLEKIADDSDHEHRSRLLNDLASTLSQRILYDHSRFGNSEGVIQELKDRLRSSYTLTDILHLASTYLGDEVVKEISKPYIPVLRQQFYRPDLSASLSSPENSQKFREEYIGPQAVDAAEAYSYLTGARISDLSEITSGRPTFSSDKTFQVPIEVKPGSPFDFSFERQQKGYVSPYRTFNEEVTPELGVRTPTNAPLYSDFYSRQNTLPLPEDLAKAQYLIQVGIQNNNHSLIAENVNRINKSRSPDAKPLEMGDIMGMLNSEGQWDTTSSALLQDTVLPSYVFSSPEEKESYTQKLKEYVGPDLAIDNDNLFFQTKRDRIYNEREPSSTSPYGGSARFDSGQRPRSYLGPEYRVYGDTRIDKDRVPARYRELSEVGSRLGAKGGAERTEDTAKTLANIGVGVASFVAPEAMALGNLARTGYGFYNNEYTPEDYPSLAAQTIWDTMTLGKGVMKGLGKGIDMIPNPYVRGGIRYGLPTAGFFAAGGHEKILNGLAAYNLYSSVRDATRTQGDISREISQGTDDVRSLASDIFSMDPERLSRALEDIKELAPEQQEQINRLIGFGQGTGLLQNIQYLKTLGEEENYQPPIPGQGGGEFENITNEEPRVAPNSFAGDLLAEVGFEKGRPLHHVYSTVKNYGIGGGIAGAIPGVVLGAMGRKGDGRMAMVGSGLARGVTDGISGALSGVRGSLHNQEPYASNILDYVADGADTLADMPYLDYIDRAAGRVLNNGNPMDLASRLRSIRGNISSNPPRDPKDPVPRGRLNTPVEEYDSYRPGYVGGVRDVVRRARLAGHLLGYDVYDQPVAEVKQPAEPPKPGERGRRLRSTIQNFNIDDRIERSRQAINQVLESYNNPRIRSMLAGPANRVLDAAGTQLATGTAELGRAVEQGGNKAITPVVNGLNSAADSIQMKGQEYGDRAQRFSEDLAQRAVDYGYGVGSLAQRASEGPAQLVEDTADSLGNTVENAGESIGKQVSYTGQRAGEGLLRAAEGDVGGTREFLESAADRIHQGSDSVARDLVGGSMDYAQGIRDSGLAGAKSLAMPGQRAADYAANAGLGAGRRINRAGRGAGDMLQRGSLEVADRIRRANTGLSELPTRAGKAITSRGQQAGESMVNSSVQLPEIPLIPKLNIGKGTDTPEFPELEYMPPQVSLEGLNPKEASYIPKLFSAAGQYKLSSLKFYR